MRRSSLLNLGIQLLLCSGLLALTSCTIFGQSQRYVQIDVRVAGGNPAGVEGTELDGSPVLAWDTSVFGDAFAAPDLKICVVNDGSRTCVEDDCPDKYFCSFIGVPISSDTFKLEVWDADIKSDFDAGDDLIGVGMVRGLNRSFVFGEAQVTVTEIPCSDKQIQVNYDDPYRPTGHYRFDSGFFPYPILFGEGSTLSPIHARLHHFSRSKPICVVGLRGCDVKTVFEIMISQVRFVAPSDDETPVVNCKVNLLAHSVEQNPVRTVIDAKHSSIVNYTLEEHVFYPGKITRRVVQDGGVIFVTTEGEGFGQYAWFNEQFGGKVIFGDIDDELADAVNEKLNLLNKPTKQNKSSNTVKKRRRP